MARRTDSRCVADPSCSRAALIECNTDQLESMREELVIYYGMDVVSLTFDEAFSASGAQKLADVD